MRIAAVDMKRMRSDHAKVPALVLDVTSARVFVLVRGRNAWHSTWIRNYTSNAAMFTDMASAKSAAEGRRGPGNVFYAYEVPALVLRATNLDYVLADLHPENPLGRYKGCKPSSEGGALFPGSPVSDALESFDSWRGYLRGYWSPPRPSEDSMVMGQVERFENLDRLAGKPLLNLHSYAQGSQWRLGWRSHPTRYTRRGVNAVVRAFANQVAEISGYHDALAIAQPGLRFDRAGGLDDLERRARAWEPVLASLGRATDGAEER